MYGILLPTRVATDPVLAMSDSRPDSEHAFARLDEPCLRENPGENFIGRLVKPPKTRTRVCKRVAKKRTTRNASDRR